MTIEIKNSKRGIIHCNGNEVIRMYRNEIIDGIKFLSVNFIIRLNEKIYLNDNGTELLLYIKKIDYKKDEILIYCDIVLEGIMIGVMPVINKNLDKIDFMKEHELVLWKKKLNN
jgi:uncharacterized protein YqgQ